MHQLVNKLNKHKILLYVGINYMQQGRSIFNILSFIIGTFR